MTPGTQDARLRFIDVIRGCACLWVAYCHAHAGWCNLTPGDGLWSLVTTAVGIGGKGVDLFVVVSGFCLFYPVALRAEAGKPQRSLRTYFSRRARRIAPVYFIALLLSLLAIGCGFRIASFRGIGDVLPHLFFVQNMLPDYIGRINGPLWSVALEVQLYVLFPLLAAVVLRRNGPSLLGVAVVVSVAASLAYDATRDAAAPLGLVSSFAVPARLVQFVLGMLTANACVFWGAAAQRALIVAGALALPLGLAAVSRTASAYPVRHLDHVAWGLVGVATVVLGLRFRRTFERFSWVSEPLRRLGLVSFSFYVLHFPIQLMLAPYAARFITGPIQGLLLFTVTGLPVMILAACGLFVLVERHFLAGNVNAAGRRGLLHPIGGASVPGRGEALHVGHVVTATGGEVVLRDS